MNFPSLIVLLIIWVVVGLVSKKKNPGGQNAQNVKAGAGKPGAKAPKASPQAPQAAPQPMSRPEPPRPSVLQPTTTATEHDASVYQGSMFAETGEGYDPCHDEQLAPLTAAESTIVAETPAEPGLQLSWAGSDVVRGIVMSEILTRK
jgi:hypothetical protein